MSTTPLRDLKRTLEMHSAYNDGKSTVEIGLLYGIAPQSVQSRFKRANLSVRPRPVRTDVVFHNGSRYSKDAKGYYIKAGARSRDYLHRVVWLEHNGQIPNGYDVHHIDGDKSNNAIENLKCIPHSEHSAIHRPPMACEVRYCTECGTPINRRGAKLAAPKVYSKRRFCSRQCCGVSRRKVKPK